jgi:hypothetical protein
MPRSTAYQFLPWPTRYNAEESGTGKNSSIHYPPMPACHTEAVLATDRRPQTFAQLAAEAVL